MTVDFNPEYRNRRQNFYIDKGIDTQAIGSIVQVLKSTKNSFDHNFKPSLVPSPSGTSAYINQSGNALPQSNPEYQYEGYIYCDGAEYYIQDYPALFEVIGTEYGGASSDGIDVISGGNGYPTTTTVTISPPSGPPVIGITPVQATATASIVNGVITGINVSNPGIGYSPTQLPTVTLNNFGAGLGFTYHLRINPRDGSIDAITKDTVWGHWPDPYMGTFMVPDLLAKRIVGNGPVYGSTSPNVGNSELGVGINTIAGTWVFNKESQLNQFSLGSISTIGYENVVDTVECEVIGSQVIRLNLKEKKLAGPPNHSHFLLHTEATGDITYPGKVVGDRYVASYRSGNGKINGFLPPGGVSLSHTHVLSKAPILSTALATYDIFNYTGGNGASGTILPSNTHYFASAAPGDGTFKLVTGFGSPLNRKFGPGSLVGGRTITTAGVPVYATEEYVFTSGGSSNTVSIPSGLDSVRLTVGGGGGSGGVYSTQGNNGGTTTVTVGSILTVTATGGSRGGAAGVSTGGAAGATGSYTTTGSAATEATGVTALPPAGSGSTSATAGGAGPYWPKLWTAALVGWSARNVEPGPPPPGGNPIGGGLGGQGISGVFGSGSNGRSLFVGSANVEVPGVTVTYPTTSQNWTASTSNASYYLTAIKFTVAGAMGASVVDPSYGGCSVGFGGAGKVMNVSMITPADNTQFQLQPGQSGRPYNGSAASATPATGGRGGDGHLIQTDGGGGGAATILRQVSGNIIIAGAGGGGGGGGYGEGACGQNGLPNNTPTDSVKEETVAIFPGGGSSGGNYGCTGGGGGGGGGGVGKSGEAGGGAAGVGGGPQGAGGGGSGGHGGGDGGRRGGSAIRRDILSISSQGNTNTGEGYITASIVEDRSYWSSGGGGGGGAGGVSFSLPATALIGSSAITATIANGGAAVSNSGISSNAGGSGFARIEFQTITGYVGGTTSISIGDVFIAGSGGQDNGMNFFASGTGTNATNGFTMPITQLPQIVFEGGGGGTGATATCTVLNNKVDTITLTNPGSNYTTAPRVRILGGAGVNNHATVSFNQINGQLENLTLQSSEVPSRYLKFGGTQSFRFVITNSFDCRLIQRLTVKICRGNNKNGGELPENGGDELLLSYNTDQSLSNFNFIGELAPIPNALQLNTDYDGTGTGTNPTNWYSYSVELPVAAQKNNVRFRISQNRASGADSSSGNDNYGILELMLEQKETSGLVFVPADGQIPVSDDIQQFDVTGSANSPYPSGIFANDATFTLSSSAPIIPVGVLDPDRVVPLIEPYCLVKYLIKAY